MSKWKLNIYLSVSNTITPALACFPHRLVSAALTKIFTFLIKGDNAWTSSGGELNCWPLIIH